MLVGGLQVFVCADALLPEGLPILEAGAAILADGRRGAWVVFDLYRGALEDLRDDRIWSVGVSAAHRKQWQHVIPIHRLRQTQAADVFDVLR